MQSNQHISESTAHHRDGDFRFLHGRSLSTEKFIKEENHALLAVTRTESASDTSVTLDLEEAALG